MRHTLAVLSGSRSQSCPLRCSRLTTAQQLFLVNTPASSARRGHLGIDPAGYVNYGHEVQDMIRGIFADLAGDHFGVDNCGTDGCSIPTYATPLPSLAKGFARMATGEGLAKHRAEASKRIVEACMAEPYFVAGEGRACTKLMQAAPGMVFAKTGAEGVYCAALPREGLGHRTQMRRWCWSCGGSYGGDGVGVIHARRGRAIGSSGSGIPSAEELEWHRDRNHPNDRGSCRQVTVLWETVRWAKPPPLCLAMSPVTGFLPTVAYDGAAFLPL